MKSRVFWERFDYCKLLWSDMTWSEMRMVIITNQQPLYKTKSTQRTRNYLSSSWMIKLSKTYLMKSWKDWRRNAKRKNRKLIRSRQARFKSQQWRASWVSWSSKCHQSPSRPQSNGNSSRSSSHRSPIEMRMNELTERRSLNLWNPTSKWLSSSSTMFWTLMTPKTVHESTNQTTQPWTHTEIWSQNESTDRTIKPGR